MNIEQRICKMRLTVQKYDQLKKQAEGALNLKELLTDKHYADDLLKINIGNIYTIPKEIDPDLAIRLKKVLIKEIDIYTEERQNKINELMEENQNG